MRKILVLCLCIWVLTETDALALSAGGKKILMGSAMAGAGAALAIHSFDRCFFKDCGGGDFEAASGVVLFGTGVTLVVWGLIQRSHSHQYRESSTTNAPFVQIGVFPVRKGVAAGAVFRW